MTSDTCDPFALPAEVEEERLHSLAQLHQLDTPPEERFARITRMARLVFDVPMASVQLIDRDRQWFKQADGLPFGKSTSRNQSVCRATIARSYEHPEDPTLVLDDATQIPEFAGLSTVGGDKGVRFYAGHPLYGPGGHAVGTFCIYDKEARSLDDNQLAAFKEMASWAQRELVSTDDLERAAHVQRQLLPQPLGKLPGYTVHAVCLPAYAVGGDFYDHYAVDGGAIFSVADVMGKGLGAAILTASVRSALRAASRAVERVGDDSDPADAVNAVALQVADDLLRTDSFVTLLHAHLDTTTGVFRYVDAGHGLTVIHRSGGDMATLTGTGLPVGILPGEVWSSDRVTIEPGDMVAVVSDGLLDLISDDADAADVMALVARHPDPQQLCEAVTALAEAQAPLDDITLVAIGRDVP